MSASTAIIALALVAEQVVFGRRRGLTFAGRVFEQWGAICVIDLPASFITYSSSNKTETALRAVSTLPAKR